MKRTPCNVVTWALFDRCESLGARDWGYSVEPNPSSNFELPRRLHAQRSRFGMKAEKKWLFTLFSAAFVSALLFLSSISGFSASYAFASHKPFASTVHRGAGYPPAFAYYISGGGGDGERMFRLLLAVYHPRNRYLLQVRADGSDDERRRLAALVKSVPAIRAFGNVEVVGKPDPATYMGSTNIAHVLHAAAILLKVDGGWDWFISLSASDYPLLSQDVLLDQEDHVPFLILGILRLYVLQKDLSHMG
ncbi:hypothetical protein RJ640_022633 [Escallonia rubra]|uniref:Uncharacterized protein n=1 Tax=Escallonia rubra TaxID=112253 RepID=A0AA88QQC2_9ASTE|nr:hypothetical protein RJ640_022633 [Escallonia rubra]